MSARYLSRFADAAKCARRDNDKDYFEIDHRFNHPGRMPNAVKQRRHGENIMATMPASGRHAENDKHYVSHATPMYRHGQ